MNVDALDGDTDLSGVQQGESGNLRSCGCDVNVLAYDGWVVASELESDSLQCLCCRLHNELSSGGGSSEGDLVDTGVLGEPWTKVVISGKSLEDTWWEELLAELGELETNIWSEWTVLVSIWLPTGGSNLRWLDDQSIT